MLCLVIGKELAAFIAAVAMKPSYTTTEAHAVAFFVFLNVAVSRHADVRLR